MATSTTTSAPAPMSIPKLRAWFSRNGNKVKHLIELRKFAADEKKRVVAYIAPLLAEYQFKKDDTGEVITTYDDLYCTLPEDEGRVQEFYSRSDELHKANGWKGDAGLWPCSVADYAAIRYEQDTLLPLIADFMGVTVVQLEYSYKTRVAAVKLVIDFYNEQYA